MYCIMKKSIIICILFSIFCLLSSCFSYENCDYLLESCSELTIYVWNMSPYSNNNYYYWLDTKNNTCRNKDACLNRRIEQMQTVSTLMAEWYDLYNYWRYEDSLEKYKKAMNIIWDKTDNNYKIAEWNIKLCYQNLWSIAMKKEQWDKAATYYNNVLKIDDKDDYAYFVLWIIRFEQKDYNNALKDFKKAYEYTTDDEIIELCPEYIEYIEFILNEKEKQKKSVSWDFFSYRTVPFLDMNNIFEAQMNVKQAESKEVIIAVIDDWVYVNHPDLSDNIWVNTDEIPNNWIDDDKNWYKDDFNWWNFVYNNNNLLPLGDHWTMVAWIIWAIRDNNEWIAWVTKNVKIMPIGSCDEDGCKDEDIIAGINYAIDNWANIINLSLWWNQFNYTNDYTKVIKRAYNHWIVAVVAAGNWDVLTDSKNGVNTSVNPLSPICNYWDNKKSIIWVWALNESWEKAKWSNYWNCVDFWALWENVFSTIIPQYSDKTWELYNELFNFWVWTCDYWNWTSFSTPIIAWIVWLWYNKYWYVSPDIVRDSLKESMWTWYIVDANKYLEILWDLDSLSNEVELSKREKFQEWRYWMKKKIHIFIDWFKKTENFKDSIDTYTSSQE